jgi:hypothetical protein
MRSESGTGKREDRNGGGERGACGERSSGGRRLGGSSGWVSAERIRERDAASGECAAGAECAKGSAECVKGSAKDVMTRGEG